MERMLTLQDLIHRNGISMKLEKVQANPIWGGRDSDSDGGIGHFKCCLSKTGEDLDVYLSIDSVDDLLTPSDVMLMLAMDASGCKLLEGFDECREEWISLFAGSDGNLKEIDEFWHEYQGRCKQTEKFRRFLGESAYEELLLHFAFE